MESRRMFLGGAIGGTVAVLAGCSSASSSDSEKSRQYAGLVADAEEMPISVNGARPSYLDGISDYDTSHFNPPSGIDLSKIDHGINVENRTLDGYEMALTSVDFETFSDGGSLGAETAEYGGFRTLEADDSNELYGFNDGTIVLGETREQYERAIDLRNGDHPRLIDSHSGFERAADEIGDPDLYSFEIGQGTFTDDSSIGNPVVLGSGFQVTEGESDMTAVAIYETADEAAANEASVNEGLSDFFTFVQDAETTVDGRVILVQGTHSTSKL